MYIDDDPYCKLENRVCMSDEQKVTELQDFKHRGLVMVDYIVGLNAIAQTFGLCSRLMNIYTWQIDQLNG